MTSEYSISIEDWNDNRWDHRGADLMYEYYLKDKETIKECKENNWEIEDIAREKADEHYPMMNYAYPLKMDPEDSEIIKVCTRTNCTVVFNNEDDTYYLALTGGGMDLSQDIALAYIIIQKWIPRALAINVSTQPALSVSKKDWFLIKKEIISQLKQGIYQDKQRIKEWREATRSYK